MKTAIYLRLVVLAIYLGHQLAALIAQSGLTLLAGLGLIPLGLIMRVKKFWRGLGVLFLLLGLAMMLWGPVLALKGEKALKAHHWIIKDFRGRLLQQNKKNNRSRLTLGVKEASLIDGRRVELEGNAVIFVPDEALGDCELHSYLRIEGDFLPLPRGGEFDYFWKFLAERDVAGVVFNPEACEVLAGPESWRTKLAGLREGLEAWFSPLGERGASFMRALVFGDRRGLTLEERQDFTAAGIIHLMAVSGMHVAVMSGVMLWILSLLGLGKRLALPLVLVMLFLYAGLCGWTASVMRAVLMLGLIGLASYFRSSISSIDILALVALILFLEDQTVTRQPGFLLSFFATAGILLFASPLTKGLRALKLPGWLSQSLGVSLAAQIAVLPILASFFGEISLVSPLANLVFVPLILGLELVGLFFPLLALLGFESLTAAIFETGVELVYQAVREVASLSWASLRIGELSWPVLALYTCGVIVLIKGLEFVILGQKKNRRLARAKEVASLLERAGSGRQARVGPALLGQSTGLGEDRTGGRDHSRREPA